MNGLYFGVIFTLCFSLVSTLKCVLGAEYGSGESAKKNVQCGDVKFCANFTYRARFGTTIFTRYACSRNDDNITTGFVRGTLCTNSGCRKLIADAHPYMPPGAKVCCCAEDYCNDKNGKVKESAMRARKRRCERTIVIKSLKRDYAEDYSFSQDCGDSSAIKVRITDGRLCEQTGCRELPEGEPGFVGKCAIICCCSTLFCNDEAGKHVGLYPMMLGECDSLWG